MFDEDKDNIVKQPQVSSVTCSMTVRLDNDTQIIVTEEMSADLLESSRSKTALLFASLRKRAIRATNAAGAQCKHLISG